MTRSSHVRSAALAAALLVAGTACQRSTGPAAPPQAATRGSTHAGLSSGLVCQETSVHAKHVNLFACRHCHPTGATFGFDVPFTFPSGATTTAGGILVPRTATAPTTCTVACHFPKGAPARTLAWTAPGPLACTECHASATLPQNHPTVAANATRADCQACHQMAGHMDGAVVVSGHAEAWTTPADPSNTQFHAYAANADLSSCTACHGATLAGGAGPACAACHDGAGPGSAVTAWSSCTMCHGGTGGESGAPPKATWGHAGEALRVGAHARHGAGSAIAPAFDCDVCHAKPADVFASGHVDGGTAEVAFGGIAAGGPAWDRSSATCAVYCHGASLDAGGTATAPSWTGGPVACGDCHAVPPPPPHAEATLAQCATCHPDTMDGEGNLIAPSAGGAHLNGIVDAASGHAAGWMDTASTNFHAISANRGLGACAECHGSTLDGGSARGCGRCHDQSLPPGIATWKVDCVMCHGGTDNQTGAPPRPTWGSTSVVAVGAHSAHVGPNPVSGAFGCEECHSTPSDVFTLGHIGGSAAVSFTGPVSGLKGGTWNYPVTGAATCSSTYCHGNFTRGIATNAPSWTGTNQAACGSCHAARPAAYLHTRHQRDYTTTGLAWWPLPGLSGWVTCNQCHSGIARSVTSSGTPTLVVTGGAGPALHVDGKPDVLFEQGGTYVIEGTQGACSSMACHPGETKYWAR